MIVAVRKQIIQTNWYLGLFGEVRLKLNHITLILINDIGKKKNASRVFKFCVDRMIRPMMKILAQSG